MRRYFPEECRLSRPGGGFILWVQLPAGVDALALYARALKAGIAITPGQLFSPTGHYNDFIRLNAANWSERAEAAVARLGEFVAGMS